MADASPPTTSIVPEARRTLIRLLRVAYPHPRFPDGPYERTADAVIAKVAGSQFEALSLAEGLQSLDAAAANGAAGKGFVDLDDSAALELLEQIASVDFFVLIRSVAVVSLYNDHETWQLLGYEGSAYEQGGYLHRGFDDLDWLPDPRIQEYDGPEQLVVVASHDQPASTGGTK